MEITEKLVYYVAELAHLRMDEAHVAQAAEDLSKMIGYVDKLQELDTDSVPPTSHANARANVFREDEERESMPREDALANAPQSKDGCYAVPRTVE